MLRKINEQPFNLNYNKGNLVVKIEDINKLTLAEKEQLKSMSIIEKAKYRDEACKRFNSAKNRSIMI